MGIPYQRSAASDFFETPYSLTRALLATGEFSDYPVIREPACGKGAISKVLQNSGHEVIDSDLSGGFDFLKMEAYPNRLPIITNPSFSLFDEFVTHAKKVSEKFAFIGKLNFLGAYQRDRMGIWESLKNVYVFNRQADYRGPIYDDGTFHVGGIVSGWFVWDMGWGSAAPALMSILDVQDWATRGQFKPEVHK